MATHLGPDYCLHSTRTAAPVIRYSSLSTRPLGVLLS